MCVVKLGEWHACLILWLGLVLVSRHCLFAPRSNTILYSAALQPFDGCRRCASVYVHGACCYVGAGAGMQQRVPRPRLHTSSLFILCETSPWWQCLWVVCWHGPHLLARHPYMSGFLLAFDYACGDVGWRGQEGRRV